MTTDLNHPSRRLSQEDDAEELMTYFRQLPEVQSGNKPTNLLFEAILNQSDREVSDLISVDHFQKQDFFLKDRINRTCLHYMAEESMCSAVMTLLCHKRCVLYLIRLINF